MSDFKQVLIDNEFRFNKSFGQNFLTDKNLLSAIVRDSGIEPNDVVLEIGAGAGALTTELCKVAKKVISFEIDENLKPVLATTLAEFSNVEVVFADALKMQTAEIEKLVGEKFHLVANLPYYITTPLVMKFLEETNKVKSLTIMVQKEVAERFTANPGTKDYGSITVAINSKANAKITRIVNRKLFYPVPNVDSAVVHIRINENKLNLKDEKTFQKLYKSAFSMRRKTLINNLSKDFGMGKEELKIILSKVGLDENVRGESLSAEKFAELSNLF